MEQTLYHSPNGRYACRQGFDRSSSESNLSSIHFIDFEEETLHELFLVTFKDFVIIFIYWVDDAHICTIFLQEWPSAENNRTDTIRPKRALYKVDFEGKYIQPKIVSYWKPDERGFSSIYGFQISQGFLTVNEQDYLIVQDCLQDLSTRSPSPSRERFTKRYARYFASSIRWMFRSFGCSCIVNQESEGDCTSFEDQPTSEQQDEQSDAELDDPDMEDEEENEDIWLRFIPKHFEDVREIDDVVVNGADALQFVKLEQHCGLQTIIAYKHLLYISHNHGGCLIMDMDNYFKVIKETSKLPSPSDFCRGINIEPILQYGGWPQWNNNRFMYMLERVGLLRIWPEDEPQLDEEHKAFIRICDLETECASGLFEIINPLIIESNFQPNRDQCIHPSGQYIQYDAQSFEIVRQQDDSDRIRWLPRKNFTYKFVSLKPVLTGLPSLKKIAAASYMLNEIRIEEKLPRCLREGRNTLKLSLL